MVGRKLNSKGRGFKSRPKMEMASKAMPGSIPVPSLGLFNKQGNQILVAKWSPPIIVFKHTREKSKKQRKRPHHIIQTHVFRIDIPNTFCF